MFKFVVNVLVGLSVIRSNAKSIAGTDAAERGLTSSCRKKCIRYEVDVRTECFLFCNQVIDPKWDPDFKIYRQDCKDRCRETFKENRRLCTNPATCVHPNDRPFDTPYEQMICNVCPCCKNDSTFRKAMQGPSEQCTSEQISFGLHYEACRCTEDGEKVCGSFSSYCDGSLDYRSCDGYHASCFDTTAEGDCVYDEASSACRIVFSFSTPDLDACIFDGPDALECDKNDAGDDDTVRSSTPGTYRSSKGELDVELSRLSPNVTNGYETKEELALDVKEASKFMLNSVILSDAGEEGYDEQFEWGSTKFIHLPPPPPGVVVAEQDRVGGPSATGIDDFETFNQEAGVDEADMLKANKDTVFVAYGDILMVYAARTGELILNLTMPEIKQASTDATGDDTFFFFDPKPRIRDLLLIGDRLAVIVEGYGSYYRDTLLGKASYIFRSLYETHVRVYDISNLPEMPLKHEKNINGRYQDARSVGTYVHIVTTSDINYSTLTTDIRRSNPLFKDLNDDEYKKAAAEAAPKLVDGFVEQFVEELTLEGLPDLTKIVLWQEESFDEEDDPESLIYGGVLFTSYTQIASFDVMDCCDDLSVSYAGSLMPSSWGTTYSTTDMLVFAGESWNWNSLFFGFVTTTYFIGFALDAASSTPIAMGSTPGSILDQFSMDIYDGHLRVATTIQERWRWVSTDVVREDGTTVETTTAPVRPESLTQNQVLILKIPDIACGDRGIFTEVGRISDIGKVDELITTARIFNKIAYVVTFLQTDPYYVLDLDPNDPKILGELEITGWSDQLLSLDDKDELIVAIGENADESGLSTGFAVSLFDSSDRTSPMLLHRLDVDDDPTTSSFSSGGWDAKAIRLVQDPQLGEDFGLLIVPLTVYEKFPATDGNFDGYVVFNVGRDGISERLRIPHVRSEDFYSCYYPAYLPDRSLVFDGKVTTFKSHSIVTTNLDTAELVWELEPPKPQENHTSCVWWI